jgi:hypothetical protein
LEAIDLTALIVWSRAGLDGDLKKAMKDGKPVIIEVLPCSLFSNYSCSAGKFTTVYQTSEVVFIITIESFRSHISS